MLSLAHRRRNPRDRSNRLLGDHSELFAKEFRSEICAIGPDQRAQFRMKTDTSKLLNIAQWCKDRTRQVLREVNIALGTVTESNPDLKTGDVMRFDYSRQSIFGRDC
jgi:hypothetical protein